MSSAESLTGRVLITGCSRGIGRALVRKFRLEGWEVCATARQPEKEGFSVPLDVCNSVSIEQAFRQVASRWDTLDVLINNAAVFPEEGDEKLEDLDLKWFHEALDCNVVGVARVTRAFLPLLRKSRHPRVVNISSGAGSISEKEDHFYYSYSVSKAALNMLTRGMAAEWKEEIIVTALSPGWVQTEMGGANAPLAPEESADSLYRTITKLSRAQSGGFFGRDGEVYAW